MNWSELYGQDKEPSVDEIKNYIANPLWDELIGFIEETYIVTPKIEYSKCTMAPGWNVKYKKSSKSICTLYPKDGSFTCLIVIGAKEAMETEFIITSCDPSVQKLYESTNTFNGGRWLMIDVISPKILEDVKKLMLIRTKVPKGKAKK